MEQVFIEPTELTELELDAVAGGFLNGSFNAFSFNGNGSHDGNGNGNHSGNFAVFSANGNGNGSADGNISIS
jgi:hypothetical protein